MRSYVASILPDPFLLLLFTSTAARPQPVTTTVVELAQFYVRAQYVFAGTVMALQPMPATRATEIGSVRLTFRVDRAIRGVRKGQSLTIREWAGLWNSGERYRVGERVLLFLYPPSKLGLTSPVGGAKGRLPIDSEGRVILLQPAPATDSPAAIGPQSRKRVSTSELARTLRQSQE